MFKGLPVVFLLVAMGANAAEFSTDAFIARAGGADIVVLGEVHDNPAHHANQADIVTALQPDALVFEMIPQDMDEALNKLRSDGAGRQDLARALSWDKSGWPDFDFYAQILEAAPDAAVFGAGQPIDAIRKAARAGAAEAFGQGARQYGLNAPLDPEDQGYREDVMAVSHCNALPTEALAGMVEVQRFRDAALADTALKALASSGPQGQVVVITGTGHADKARGMPALIAYADSNVKLISLGQGEGAYDPDSGQVFDAWATAPAPDREDPCAAFDSKKSE